MSELVVYIDESNIFDKKKYQLEFVFFLDGIIISIERVPCKLRQREILAVLLGFSLPKGTSKRIFVLTENSNLYVLWNEMQVASYYEGETRKTTWNYPEDIQQA